MVVRTLRVGHQASIQIDIGGRTDHLGKLITYAAALEARWAVLVAKQFRPEHRSALTWLNSISGEGSGFFGIEVQAVRIADSPTAIRLDIVVKPDDFSRRARARATNLSETERRNMAGTRSPSPASTSRYYRPCMWTNASAASKPCRHSLA